MGYSAIAGLLLGDALDAYTSMTSEATCSYDAVKKAVLVRYEVNAESYRLRFQQATKKENLKKPLQQQLTDQLTCWSGAARTGVVRTILAVHPFRAWYLAEIKEARVSKESIRNGR